jgi:WhiB family redox-sensing transcriptional regulator
LPNGGSCETIFKGNLALKPLSLAIFARFKHKFPTARKRNYRMDMQWLNQARCLNEDPELFFPVGNTGPAVEQIEQAKSVCRECGVSTQCLEYAIKENQDTGVWGGLSEDERKSLKRKYARARRAG